MVVTVDTHVFGRSSLQINRSREELIEDRKNTVALEQALQERQEAKDELELPPRACVEMLLCSCFSAREDLLRDFGLVRVGEQDDGGREGDLDRLLEDATNLLAEASIMDAEDPR